MDADRNRFTDLLTGLKQARDEIRLKVHLAGMDARETWASLEPRVDELERQLSAAGDSAVREVGQAIEKLGRSLTKLRNDLLPPPPS